MFPPKTPKMRTKIKELQECLKKYNHPPEYRKQAVDDVIKQHVRTSS